MIRCHLSHKTSNLVVCRMSRCIPHAHGLLIQQSFSWRYFFCLTTHFAIWLHQDWQWQDHSAPETKCTHNFYNQLSTVTCFLLPNICTSIDKLKQMGGWFVVCSIASLFGCLVAVSTIPTYYAMYQILMTAVCCGLMSDQWQNETFTIVSLTVDCWVFI